MIPVYTRRAPPEIFNFRYQMIKPEVIKIWIAIGIGMHPMIDPRWDERDGRA